MQVVFMLINIKKLQKQFYNMTNYLINNLEQIKNEWA